MSDKDCNYICKQHSGLETDMLWAKDNISQLWKKWDRMVIVLIGGLVTLVMNLIGVVWLILRTKPPG